jgi:FdhD protein
MTRPVGKIDAGMGGAATPEEYAMKMVPVRKIDAGVLQSGEDNVAVEEPLEISLAWPADGRKDHPAEKQHRNIAVTMRTPGDDDRLALGFLFTEGIIRSPDQIISVSGDDSDIDTSNRVTVMLQDAPEIELSTIDRNFYVTSSCGVCGKASIAAIHTHAQFPIQAEELQVAAQMLTDLPGQLVAQQRVFSGTGSIHAAALFGPDGLTGCVYEDVGRHNAVDKLVGASFVASDLPLRNKGILVSGRASFELVQKARMAGCAILAAVGAPSSLAIDLAWDSDMTLVGFLRDGRFNIYTGPARIVHS